MKSWVHALPNVEVEFDPVFLTLDTDFFQLLFNAVRILPQLFRMLSPSRSSPASGIRIRFQVTFCIDFSGSRVDVLYFHVLGWKRMDHHIPRIAVGAFRPTVVAFREEIKKSGNKFYKTKFFEKTFFVSFSWKLPRWFEGLTPGPLTRPGGCWRWMVHFCTSFFVKGLKSSISSQNSENYLKIFYHFSMTPR